MEEFLQFSAGFGRLRSVKLAKSCKKACKNVNAEVSRAGQCCEALVREPGQERRSRKHLAEKPPALGKRHCSS